MRLTVETGPLAGTQIQLERDQHLTIGSGEGCALRIPEPGIAREHAVVKALRDEGFGVKALAPGVRVNGTEIEATPLREGDLLELGASRIRYGQPQVQRGPKIAGFEILGELGRGGMGVVYRATQQSLHRQVALKVLDKKLLRDPQFVGRFVAEARAAAKLSHPHVVQVFDVDHDGELYYYAMELMTGSLEHWLKKNGRMPVDEALRVVDEAASGLAYAESLGIVHRDIKPDNLMLDHHGNVKIADLGLARTDEDADDELHGTPHFMAPEQVLRKGADHRSDLYALGCTFYRLITGRTPFRGQTVKDILRAHVKEAPEPPHKIEGTIPPEVSAIVLRLMAKDPAERYQSATELQEDLQALLQPRLRKGLWIGLSAAAVLVAGGAIVWAATRPADVVVERQVYDDPEKQRFADENVELRARAKEDAATIALLRARLRGSDGLELATALDEVASQHAGTKAATEATSLAQATRADVQRRQAAQQQRQQAATAALALVQRGVDAELQKGEPAAALRLVDAATAPADADADAFAAGVATLRANVTAGAKAMLERLRADVETGARQQDAELLGAAHDRLRAILEHEGGWPATLLPDRGRVEQLAATARQALETVESAQLATMWRSYDDLLRAPDGPLAKVRAADFAAGADALDAFAKAAGGAPPAQQATALAAALRTAQGAVAAVAAAAEQGALQLPVGEAQQGVARIDVRGGTMTLTDAKGKNGKESTVPLAQVTPEQWRSLFAQLPSPPSGKDAMLGLLALATHVEMARGYLQRLAPGNDDSGTGDAAFRGDALWFENALRELPAEDTAWCKGLRNELQSARLLTAGLRALSERRNLAAASHLERLLADHPHSLIVANLP